MPASGMTREGMSPMPPEITHREIFDGFWAWCLPDGTYHRDDGPATETRDGSTGWYRHGTLHRTNGPARMSPRRSEDEPGFEEWWVDGKRHREDGPALIDGLDQEWWVDGQLHREDGPAQVLAGGGDVRWYWRGKLHRNDGPAIEYEDGTVEFYVHGQLHRLDGPARDYAGGGHEWFVRAKRVPLGQTAVLETLWRQRRRTDLELVLSTWTPDGPSPRALLDAITAARQ